jgi:hypothetical protein
MAKQLIKLKPASTKVVVLAFALFLFAASISAFGWFSVPNVDSLILSLSAVLVIFIEVGLVKVFGKGGQGLDLFSAFGVVAAILLLVTLGLEFMGITFAALEGIRGLVYGVMGISFLIETFVR